MTIYCPYTDRDIERTAASEDHIIPMSLGGCNQFTILADRKANSTIGTEIEGGLSKDFFTSAARVAHDARGQSRKQPTIRTRHARLEGSDVPYSVTLARDGLRVFDPINKIHVHPSGPVRMQFQLDLDAFKDSRMRFIAKIALGFGHSHFGTDFRDFAAHSQLRRILWARPGDAVWSDKTVDISADLPVLRVRSDDVVAEMCEALVKGFPGQTTIGLLPSSGRLTCFVGILGQYAGFLSFGCDLDSIWREPANRSGYFLIIGGDGVRTVWLEDAVKGHLLATKYRLTGALPSRMQPEDEIRRICEGDHPFDDHTGELHMVRLLKRFGVGASS